MTDWLPLEERFPFPTPREVEELREAEYYARSPVPEVRILDAMLRAIRTGDDVYLAEGVAFIWYSSEDGTFEQRDAALFLCAARCSGQAPAHFWEWVEEELREELAAARGSYDSPPSPTPVFDFLVQCGLAFGQRFLVQARPWSSVSYEGEHDSGVEWDIVYREPFSAERTLAAFEEFARLPRRWDIQEGLDAKRRALNTIRKLEADRLREARREAAKRLALSKECRSCRSRGGAWVYAEPFEIFKECPECAGLGVVLDEVVATS